MRHANSKANNRRNFLLALGAGGVATAAAVATTLAPRATSSENQKDASRGRGYHETAHIRNYYRSTQV